MSASLLTLGGLTALAVSAWSHIKQALNYLSSFLVIQTNINNHYLQTVVTAYLKTQYSLLPSGIYVIGGLLMNVRSPALRQRFVPYRYLNPVNIFWKKGQVILVKSSADTLHLLAVRGNLNPQKLVLDALDYYEDELLGSTTRDSRFYVTLIQGSEKFGYDGQLTRKNSGSFGSESSIDPPSNSSTRPVDITVDKSFRFSKDQYVFSNTVDAFGTLHLPDYVHEHVRKAKLWFDHGDWYQSCNIPWRKGWLIYGPGGTGKSSLARAMAQHLGIPLYRFQLNTLSDQELTRHWECVSWPAIALFEDFDTVFHGREPQTEHKSLTFDCILNLLSGVDSKSGVFLIVTTNNLEHIDPAMGTVSEFDGQSTRPGRLDVAFELSYMEERERRAMAARILQSWPNLQDEVVGKGHGMTCAQFQDLCTTVALDMISKYGVPIDALDSDRKDGKSDSKDCHQ